MLCHLKTSKSYSKSKLSISQVLVLSMDSSYSGKRHPNSCLSNDKCSVLRKYSGDIIKSVGEKIAKYIKLLNGNEHL